LVALARRINDGQVDRAIDILRSGLDTLVGRGVLLLGLTYREGVKELAYSRGVAMATKLAEAGARVLAYDPLLADDEISALGLEAWTWGAPMDGIHGLVSQTADALFAALDLAWFPELRVVIDGRNSLRRIDLPPGVAYHGFGVSRAEPGA
jgi:UDP-N-acetyl-D-mannosaminuronate dehydrogenase